MDLTGYSSNVLGALTVAAIAGIAYCVKNKLKHSECDFDTKCLKIRSHEDNETRNTIRREVLDELRKEGRLVSPTKGERTPSRDIEEGVLTPSPVSPFKLLGASPTLPVRPLKRPRTQL